MSKSRMCALVPVGTVLSLAPLEDRAPSLLTLVSLRPLESRAPVLLTVVSLRSRGLCVSVYVCVYV